MGKAKPKSTPAGGSSQALKVLDERMDKSAPVAGTKPRAQKMLSAGINEARKPLFEKLRQLAESLVCNRSDLVWHAIEEMIKNPPTVAPQGVPTARGPTGSAAGFWVVPVVDEAGKATGINVVEVESRCDELGGRTFYRYKSDDARSRLRARNQALRAATYDLKLLGLPTDSVSIDEFEVDE